MADPDELYITFFSAVGLTARGYSKKINLCLNDCLPESPQGRIGIIVMDYFEESRGISFQCDRSERQHGTDRRSRTVSEHRSRNQPPISNHICALNWPSDARRTGVLRLGPTPVRAVTLAARLDTS